MYHLVIYMTVNLPFACVNITKIDGDSFRI